MPTRTFIGYLDLAEGDAPRGSRASSRLVKMSAITDSVVQWKATLTTLIAYLRNQVSVPGPFGGFLNLSREEALDFVEYFVRTDNLQFNESAAFQANYPPRGERPSGFADSTLYKDDILERVWDTRLVSTKARQRGLFLPGVRKTRSSGGNFMRLRVPHR